MARRSITVVGSDGKAEGVSWYDGATEAAVMRCALVALGLPASDSAHLLWKSGDIVDFSKPIADGATLHLDTSRNSFPSHGAADDDVYALGYGGGGFDPSVVYNGERGGSALAQRRVTGSNSAGDRGPQTRSWGDSGGGSGGGGGSGDIRVAQTRCGGSITAISGTGGDQERRRRVQRPESRPLSSESSLAKRRALLAIRRFFGVGRGCGGASGGRGMLSRFLDRTTGAADSDEELERRPLLGVRRASSSTSLLSPSSSSSSLRGGDGRAERGAHDVDGDAHNPDHQRAAILKLKRINAHLANERTFLAWVRCMGKMVTAAVLSLSLGSSAGASFAFCFVGMGSVYLAMCPYVVFVGARRYRQSAEVMQGSVHEAFSYFSRGQLKGLTMLMSALAAITLGIMTTQLLASL